MPQVRYCDQRVNPTYNGRQDDYRHPINCTWGFHRPPKLPEDGATEATSGCERNVSKILEARLREPKRDWYNVGRRERWSTKDRPGYLYRQYM